MTITTHGGPVDLSLESDGNESYFQVFQNAAAVGGSLAFLKGSTVISLQDLAIGLTGATNIFATIPPSTFHHLDTSVDGAPGTYTYKVQIQIGGGSSQTVTVGATKLVAKEEK